MTTQVIVSKIYITTVFILIKRESILYFQNKNAQIVTDRGHGNHSWHKIRPTRSFTNMVFSIGRGGISL